MTIRQYITHLWSWLISFPLFNESEHDFTGIAGSGEYHCLVCNCKEKIDEAK